MKSINSIEEALATFEESAAINARSSETGDYRKGNRHFEFAMRSIVYLYEHNHLTDLEPLLHHEYVGVRSWAAFALLPLMEEKCKTVLQEIIDNYIPIHSFDAELLLKRWNDHEIIFPYQEGFHW